jgi:hypothetical protein
MLYRGDSRHIEMFDINATDKNALFGPGLYLTSDPGVAHDYTAARNDERVYPADRNDPECMDVILTEPPPILAQGMYVPGGFMVNK